MSQADGVISSSLNTLLGEHLEWRRCARLNESVCELTQIVPKATVSSATALSSSEGAPSSMSVRIAVVNHVP